MSDPAKQDIMHKPIELMSSTEFASLADKIKQTLIDVRENPKFRHIAGLQQVSIKEISEMTTEQTMQMFFDIAQIQDGQMVA